MIRSLFRHTTRSRRRSSPNGLSSRRQGSFRPAIDRLENRFALALDTLSIGGTETATYIDLDFDIVGVFVTGSAGTAVFRNASNQPVADGENIASIAIAGASSDFALIFIGATAGGNGNAVELGTVTATTSFAGIYTTPEPTRELVYSLTSFSGRNFSAGGGLFVDYVAPNGDITLVDGLASKASIVVRQDFGRSVDGSVTEGASLTLGSGNSTIAGTVQMRGIPQGDSVLSQVTLNGSPSSTFVLQSELGGTSNLVSNGTFRGTINIGSSFSGNLVFNGGIAATAVLQAGFFRNTLPGDTPAIQVFGDIAGTIVTNSADLEIDTLRGSILSSAKILSANRLDIAYANNYSQAEFTGSVQKGATLSAFSSALVFCDGDFAGTLASSGGSDSTLGVGGSIKGASITTTGNTVLDVAGSITKKSFIYSLRQLTLDVGGSVNGKSRIITHDGPLTGSVGGSVTDGRIQSGDDLTLTVGDAINNSRIDAAGRIVVTGSTSISNARVVSSSNSVTVATTGSLLRSRIVSSDDTVSLSVGGNALDNQVLTDDDVTVSVTGNFRGGVETYNGGTVSVGGSVLRGSFLNSADNLLLQTGGNFDGLLTAERADVEVLGNVGKSARIIVDELTRESAGATPWSFFVGGNFSGILAATEMVVTFDSSVTLATFVEGDVTSTARLTIGRLAGAPLTYRFGGNMDGVLTIKSFEDSNDDKSLVIEGRANQIVIGGPVIFDTTIGGTLRSMSAGGSVFVRTGEASGAFLTGLSEAVVGTLTAGTFGRGDRTVTPTLPLVG